MSKESEGKQKRTINIRSKLFLTVTIFSMSVWAFASHAQDTSEKRENRQTSVNSSQTLPPSTVEKPKPPAKPQKEPLDFSSEGRSGQQTAGESRGGCTQVEIPLTAIAPASNVSKTISSHPQWWFYNPYPKSEIKKIEFVLQNQQRQDILRTNLALTETPYFYATIPGDNPGIKENSWYRWYLKVYCHKGENTVPLFVSGWVKRIMPKIETNQVSSDNWTITEYIAQNLWLDAINLLLTDKTSQSSTSNCQQTWQQVINSSEISLNLPFLR